MTLHRPDDIAGHAIAIDDMAVETVAAIEVDMIILEGTGTAGRIEEKTEMIVAVEQVESITTEMHPEDTVGTVAMAMAGDTGERMSV